MATKRTSLMKNAQAEKTKQTIDQLVQWFATKEQFYKSYFPIQQTISKGLFQAAECTLAKLQEVSQIIKEERQIQAFIYEKTEKNVLNTLSAFQPHCEEGVDEQGQKIKIELPSWSSNIDRIFISLGKNQKDKQSQIKKIYKTLEHIEDAVKKEEGRYHNQVKKSQKELTQMFSKLDDAEKEQSKALGKLIKESKNQELKQSDFFIGELKKIQNNVLSEINLFANRGKRIVEFIQTLLKLEKEVASKIKQVMTAYLNYRKNFLGIDAKAEEGIWGQVALCQQKIEVERVTYFNKTLLKGDKIAQLKKLVPGSEGKNNWQTMVKFLQLTEHEIGEAIKAQKSMGSFLKNISYRCWSQIALAQGWLIESFTPSVMYMTYDHIMIIYSQEGQFLKRIVTSASKITKVEGNNTIFLQEKVKGFFTDSLEEYKIRFQDGERLEQFQLFMENQIL